MTAFSIKKLINPIYIWAGQVAVQGRLFAGLYLQKIEYYQPLYGFRIFNYKVPQRSCTDRADTIYGEIKNNGSGAKILDIGCSLGYFSHYFADRDYFVDGIDFDPKNITICKLLKRINRNATNFFHAEFSIEYVSKIKPSQYDMAFLFSVIHHIIFHKGLAYAQDLVAQLLEKIPILIVELAVKHEDTDAAWRTTLPHDELEIFAKCQNISIKKIGYFRNHLSNFLRPMYIIQKNDQQFGGVSYPIINRKYISHLGNKHNNCHYYESTDCYIKHYFLKGTQEHYNNVRHEIEIYKKLKPNNFFPKLLQTYQDKDSLTLVFTKLPGQNLKEFMLTRETPPPFRLFIQLIQALEFLYQHGFYHNDIRLWNLLYQENDIYLVDLELANEFERENTNLALLWIIAKLHHFKPCNFSYPIVKGPVFDESYKIQAVFQPIIEQLQSTAVFTEFLTWFNKYKTELSLD